MSRHSSEVINLSNILKKMQYYTDVPSAETYRNPNSVYMKLCNYLSLDPSYSGVGLHRVGKTDKEIWEEFSQNRKRLSKIAGLIREFLTQKDNIRYYKMFQKIDDEDTEFYEGKILFRLHKYRERNNENIQTIKKTALEEGFLNCQVCGFNFQERYGEIGVGYIEAHSTIPPYDYDTSKSTKPEDIALVCSNCHRMLHKYRPWLRKNELEKLIEKTKISFYF